jgi:hypothetical protein
MNGPHRLIVIDEATETFLCATCRRPADHAVHTYRDGSPRPVTRLSRFDHDRHGCYPNPIECPFCHGDGTGESA